MDPQTILALCAIFSVVLGMIGISQRRRWACERLMIEGVMANS